MKRFATIISSAMALFIAIGAAAETRREYLDNVTRLADSTIVVAFPPDARLVSQALEVRASLPKAAVGSTDCSISLMWDVAPDLSAYYRATLRPVEPTADEIVDSRMVELTVVRHTQQTDSLILARRLRNGFGLGPEENSLGIEIDRQSATALIYGGHEQPESLAEVKTGPMQSTDMAVQSQSEAIVSLLVSEYSIDDASLLHTEWTPSALATRLAASTQPEGFYRYLDRNTDPRYCKLGGDYTLAVVASDLQPGTYDIIYVEGADILRGLWKPGMLKGRLTPTIFRDHYNLQWFGSSTTAVADECSAELEQGTILRLDFPLLKSSVRYVRTPIAE